MKIFTLSLIFVLMYALTPAAQLIVQPSEIEVHSETAISITAQDNNGNPIPNAEIRAEGFDLLSETVYTDSSGHTEITLTAHYGPSIKIFGKKLPEFVPFYADINITGTEQLINPNINTSNDIGLEDTIALNLPAKITAFSETEDISLWITESNNSLTEYPEGNADIIVHSLQPVRAYISKWGYDIYQEDIPVKAVYGSVTGKVTNAQTNEDVPDVYLELYDAQYPNSPLYTAMSNEYGNFNLCDALVCQDYIVKARKFGYADHQETFLLDYGYNSLSIKLNQPDTFKVWGLAYCSDCGGGPLPYADIYIYTADSLNLVTTLTTEEDGTYEVFLPSYTYYMKMVTPGYKIVTHTIELNENKLQDFASGPFPGMTEDFSTSDGGFTTDNSSIWEWGTDSTIDPYYSNSFWGTVMNGAPEGGIISYLEIPEFAVGRGWYLIFDQWRDFGFDSETESILDGGNVKYSTDNGETFQILDSFITEGGSFSSEEVYDGVICSHTGNPMSGEDSFTGTSAEWKRVIFSLSDFNELPIKIRFYFAASPDTERLGWYIDNIYISTKPVSIDDDSGIPASFSLFQNRPNPFNPDTEIEFYLNETGFTELKIFNINGKLVKTLISGETDKGFGSVVWDGRDNSGRSVSSGVYYYLLKSGDRSETRKMLLLK